MSKDERAEKLSKALDGYADRAKALRASLPDVPYGQRALNAREHAMWFEQKAASDPYWMLALPLVEGGKAELQRYNRTRQKGAPPSTQRRY